MHLQSTFLVECLVTSDTVVRFLTCNRYDKADKQLESAQGWIAQPAAPEWGGGQKAPNRHPSLSTKVSVRPLTQTAGQGW